MIYLKKYKRNIILITIMVFSLFFGYKGNLFSNVSKDYYDTFQKDSEELIYGELALTESNGLFYNSGILTKLKPESGVIDSTNNLAYINEKPLEKKEDVLIYSQQIGLQGRVFSFLNYISPFSNENNIRIFESLNVVFMALCLVLLIKWIHDEFGTWASSMAFLFCLFNPWFTMTSRNLYWCFWLFFLPILCNLYIYKYIKDRNNALKYAIIASFVTVFIRNACGYEFISTLLINMEIPIIYYFIKEKWNNKMFMKHFSLIGIAGVLGFSMALFLNILINFSYYNDLQASIEPILMSIAKRTGAMGTAQLDSVYAESLQPGIINVITSYLNNTYPYMFYKFNTGAIMIFSCICFCFSNMYTKGKLFERCKGFICLILISFSGPISWIFLAKGHAVIHPHINNILWMMPFLIFVFALIGICISFCIKEYSSRVRTSK